MAATVQDISNSQRDAGGTDGLTHRIFDVTIPSGAYVTGGVSIPSSSFGFSTVIFFLAEADTQGYKPVYDHSAGKLKVFGSGTTGSTFGELANAAAVTVKARVLVFGK